MTQLLSFEMESGGRRLFMLSVLRWRVEGGAICQGQVNCSIYSPFVFLVGSVRFIGSVLKPKPNRTEPARFYGFKNRFNRFFISVRFSRLNFLQFFRFSRLFGFFEHPQLKTSLSGRRPHLLSNESKLLQNPNTALLEGARSNMLRSSWWRGACQWQIDDVARIDFFFFYFLFSLSFHWKITIVYFNLFFIFDLIFIFLIVS